MFACHEIPVCPVFQGVNGYPCPIAGGEAPAFEAAIEAHFVVLDAPAPATRLGRTLILPERLIPGGLTSATNHDAQ